jgi:hypothetical protein
MNGAGRRILLKGALAWALAGAARAETDTGSAPRIVPETLPEASVGATLSESDRMLVQIMIAGRGPYPFIVDTAAERSVIARELAAELQLKEAGRLGLLAVTSRRVYQTVEAPGVEFVPGRRLTLRAFALDGAHIGAAGVLGIDALRGQRVVLDFAAGELRVAPAPQRERPPLPNEIVVQGRRRLGQLVLAECSIGSTPVDVIVDSGIQVSLGNPALRRLLTTRANRFEPISIFGITGESQTADYTRADRLVVGGAALIGMPVAFANAYFFIRAKLTRRPALLLGMDALRMFTQVTVDFHNHEARFVLPETVMRQPARR